MRIEVSPTCSRGVKYLLVLYTVVSLVLTANHFYSSHGSDRSVLTEGSAPIFPRADEDELVIPKFDQLDDSDKTFSAESVPPPLLAPTNGKGHSVVWTYDEGKQSRSLFSQVDVTRYASSRCYNPTNAVQLCLFENLF